MKTPRLLASAALLFWGMQTGALPASVLMAALLAVAFVSPWRIELSDRDFYRVTDFTSVVFAGTAVFCFNRYGVRGIYMILAWAPYWAFLPMLAQRWSTASQTPLAALFYGLRHADGERETIDVAPAYALVCMISAATGIGFDHSYFVGCVVLVGWVLMTAKPVRHAYPTMAVLLAVAIGVSAAGQLGVRSMQNFFESAALYWFYQFFAYERDPEQQLTAIGMIGRMKISDQIHVRIHSRRIPEIPLLLQEATYSEYRSGIWSSPRSPFAAVDADLGGGQWTVNTAAGPAEQLDISTKHKRELGVVPLPAGVTRIRGAEIAEVQRNGYWTYMLEMPPGQARYRADYLPDASPGSEILEVDSSIPEDLQDLFGDLAAELRLDELDGIEALRAIARYFEDNYEYALVQRGSRRWRFNSLKDFLTESHAGHCEYFATATVLLLRAAGIPARYAVGYLVQEYSPLERAWVARARHRHAWAVAHVDGRWETVDTTPPAWFELEDAAASDLQWLVDAIAWLKYRFDRIGRGETTGSSQVLLWLIPPLAILLIWRLYRRGSLAQVASGAAADAPRETRGLDSELYGLIARYAAENLAPLPGETLQAWRRRVLPPDERCEAALDLHYRYRFDPTGISAADRASLSSLVGALMGSRDSQSR